VLKIRHYSIVAILVSLVLPTASRAAVSLAFVDTDGTSNGSTNVLPGGSFNVRLNLVSTVVGGVTDRTAAIDYYLTMLGGGSGLFQITDRNLTPPAATAATFATPYYSDAEVEALPSALLDPQNNEDLGARVNDPSQPNGAGTFFVAFYTIKVSAATPLGTYSLQTISDDATGWGDSNFEDHEFSQHANYTILVPEPTGLAACGILCLLAGRRRTA
jgi:hypothetical protein